MKKLAIVLGVLAVLLFGGMTVAQKVIMGGESYYVQVTNEGQREETKDDNGSTMVEYKYTLPGYDEDGKQKDLEFSAFKDRPLRTEAYLKITWNEKKGVTSWEEVKKTDVPKKAMKQLEKGA